MPDTPTTAELVELVSQISLAATGQSWHPQTSNAAWFLVRYGGAWAEAAAEDFADVLDRADEVSAALDAWPVLGDAAPGPEGLPSQDLPMTSRREFWDARINVEQDGVVAVGTAKHLLATADSAERRTACGLVPPGAQTRVARPRRETRPWCVACAVVLAQDLGELVGWTGETRT